MPETWWRGAAIYQVYPRSFADGNGDGVGDLAGLRARLGHLADLGIDAIWLNPWYPSPLADGGYDVADYRDIHPSFGTLAEAEALIAEAHERGIRVIVDVVPNHTSDQSAWFKAALAAGPGSPERARFWFRPGVGEGPPNDWQSIFGGPAWTQVPDGEWYLHLFAPEQPDFNWTHPDVHADFLDVLRFWFDRGVDGIRIDSAAVLVKDPDAAPDGLDPYTDRDGCHDIYRAWRALTDTYEGRMLIGEVWLPDAERLARYLRPDELHTVFNFPFLGAPWNAPSLRAVIDDTFATLGDAPATWVLSNHDVTRPVTRYGREDTSFDHADRGHGRPTDPALGLRRARAAALLALALPGSVYVYQGEELGLPEVEDLPDEVLDDPIWTRSGHTDRGRDGCRVPLPWSGDAPPFGFGGTPWLPQPPEWKNLTVEAQRADPDSVLALYRTALRLRRELLGDGTLTWLDLGEDVLAFTRESGVTCLVNLGSEAIPFTGEVLLSSAPVPDGVLPQDTAVWLR
ncbi:alpha-amylase family glycosyl hydrolase [Actinocorallia sp. A-T 12471]|uniref:glycoside hydrolase family 13 protein n=1 Tax=Actinocorallia sp. A-T 12471 TaxID=3089813 RepID=UPI0029D259DE|nr:alpha-amylase family glycosyl hydrolase [Actinocorallia sp. A-T 12471]MDX6740401.1 alpha-amylase family glycosyl hydrolase [Actinocorallia sp. A-T 12471]